MCSRAADGGPPPERPARPLGVLLLFVAAYVSALIGAMTFVHPSCDLGTRYLYPILPPLIVVLICAACDGLRTVGDAPVARVVLILVCMVSVAANLLQTVPWAAHAAGSGTGFLSRSWRNSPIIARLAELPPDMPIFSNRNGAVYIFTGKSTYSLPHSDGSAGAVQALAQMRKGMQMGGVAAYFTRVDRPYLLSQEQLEAALPLRPILQSDDGALYQWGGPPVP